MVAADFLCSMIQWAYPSSFCVPMFIAAIFLIEYSNLTCFICIFCWQFYFCEHGFVIKLKRVKFLDFIISGCILYTKISRMIIFGLVFLVLFWHWTIWCWTILCYTFLYWVKQPQKIHSHKTYRKSIRRNWFLGKCFICSFSF